MRIAAIAAFALFASAGSVAAAPASVHVSIGPELQAKAEKTYGVRDINDLAADLQRHVEAEVAKTGAFDGAQIELQLADAQPNRPTFKQMADRPGLSFDSFSVGGARIEGHAILPSGRVVPLSFSYFETDIRYARYRATWSDAEQTIDRFAHRIAHQELASR